MKCLILAAGYATRLYPLTENFPKPLLKVGEKSILDWLVDDLVDATDIDEFVVISNHKFAQHFENWKSNKQKTRPYEITVIDDGTSTNETRLGAVKDIQLAVEKLNLADDLLVMAGDNVLDLRDPAIVIRKDSITFNTACITGLEDVVYVHVMFNNDLKRIVVRGCDENDKDALRWCVAKPDKRKSRKMSCKPFATLVYQKMGWDSECRYKMLGYRITFEGETLYVFDLLVPEIFHEGQRKKNAVDSQDNAASTKPVNSRKGFYLDDIVGTFGVPVEEHRKESEVKQMDGYVSMGILTGKIAPEAGKD